MNINVVIGLLFNDAKKILIALRPPHVVSPGFWEFPGGKVEKNEILEDALIREFQEEIGVVVKSSEFFFAIEKNYPDKKLLLNIFRITDYFGEPRGCENQEIRWVSCDELKNYDFLPANAEIIEKLLTSV